MPRKDLQLNLAVAALAVLLFAGLSFVDLPLATYLDRRICELELRISPPTGTPSPRFAPAIPSSNPESASKGAVKVMNEGLVRRPAGTLYFELAALLLLGAFASFSFMRFGEAAKLAALFGLIGLTLGVGTLSLSVLGIWFKTSLIIGCLIFLYLSFAARQLVAAHGLRQDVYELRRLLAVNYQKQGLLDLAFERLKECPQDKETKDLIYNLGLDYESRKKIDEALAVYRYINGGRRFGDVLERIAKLEAGGDPAWILGGSRKGASGGVLAPERRSVGRYELLEEIGKGTMGLIYKAVDPRINRPLAIKVIRFSDEFDESLIQEIKARFFREAEIAGRLSHPVIVTIHDVGEEGDLTYMAMEYLEGRDLTHYCSRKNLLPLKKVLEVTADVAEALDYAHKEQVIHRDIKPANIMLLKSGEVKVTDFGIAKAVSSSKTKTGVILGTPNYMSPEQIMGRKVDSRTDIFSLGVLFFQLVTGDLPFHGENLSSLLYQITQAEHPSARQYDTRIPKACDQIITKALAKDPDRRFQTAGAMAKYLRIFLSKANGGGGS